MFSKDFVVFASNDLTDLECFRQGMMYATQFPKEYDHYFKKYPDLLPLPEKKIIL